MNIICIVIKYLGRPGLDQYLVVLFSIVLYFIRIHAEYRIQATQLWHTEYRHRINAYYGMNKKTGKEEVGFMKVEVTLGFANLAADSCLWRSSLQKESSFLPCSVPVG